MRAQCQGHYAGSHRGGRSAGRSAGCVIRVVGVQCGTGLVTGEFGRGGLAEDHGAGTAQAAHHSGVRDGIAPLMNRTAERRRKVDRVENVLDGDRHGIQPTQRLAARAFALPVGRLQADHALVEAGEGVDALLYATRIRQLLLVEDLEVSLTRREVLAVLRRRELLDDVSALHAAHLMFLKSRD